MYKKIFILFIIWRISLFIFAFIGGLFLPFTPRFPYSETLLVPTQLPYWIWSFANFDGVHYITIANSGYMAQFTQVFFPLYPLIIRFVKTVLFDNYALISGLLVSNVSFLISLFIFARLLEIDYKKDQILWIIVILLTFPSSFFFGGLYSESLFFLFIISSFYFARKKHWLYSGLFGALSSAARLAGIFLLPSLLWEWYQQTKTKTLKVKTPAKNTKSYHYFTKIFNFTYHLLHSPILYIVPLGFIIYMIYLQINYHDYLYFWHAQPVFGASRSGTNIILLPQVIWRYIKIFTSVPPTVDSFFIPFLEFFATITALIILFYSFRLSIRRSYIIFAIFSVLVPTLTGTFSSMPRYILVAFPIYIVLGTIKSKPVKLIILSINLLLLSILTILFTRGIWVS